MNKGVNNQPNSQIGDEFQLIQERDRFYRSEAIFQAGVAFGFPALEAETGLNEILSRSDESTICQLAYVVPEVVASKKDAWGNTDRARTMPDLDNKPVVEALVSRMDHDGEAAYFYQDQHYLTLLFSFNEEPNPFLEGMQSAVKAQSFLKDGRRLSILKQMKSVRDSFPSPVDFEVYFLDRVMPDIIPHHLLRRISAEDLSQREENVNGLIREFYDVIGIVYGEQGEMLKSLRIMQLDNLFRSEIGPLHKFGHLPFGRANYLFRANVLDEQHARIYRDTAPAQAHVKVPSEEDYKSLPDPIRVSTLTQYEFDFVKALGRIDPTRFDDIQEIFEQTTYVPNLDDDEYNTVFSDDIFGASDELGKIMTDLVRKGFVPNYAHPEVLRNFMDMLYHHEYEIRHHGLEEDEITYKRQLRTILLLANGTTFSDAFRASDLINSDQMGDVVQDVLEKYPTIIDFMDIVGNKVNGIVWTASSMIADEKLLYDLAVNLYGKEKMQQGSLYLVACSLKARALRRFASLKGLVQSVGRGIRKSFARLDSRLTKRPQAKTTKLSSSESSNQPSSASG